MIQGNIRFFRGTKQMQHTSHQEYSDSELEWSNLVLQFCLILPKTYVKGCLTVKFPAKNTGAYDTHAPIFYTYSVSNICSDEVNYYFPAKRFLKKNCFVDIIYIVNKVNIFSFIVFKSIKCCFKM